MIEGLACLGAWVVTAVAIISYRRGGGCGAGAAQSLP
jgi:hypothetical protein